MVFTGNLNRPSPWHLMSQAQLDEFFSEEISDNEWHEMHAIKKAINDHPASVHPGKMERFTELFVQTLIRKQIENNDQGI
jgi:hypothetical protein